MEKQIFTIILLTIVSLNVLGQSFKLDATGANDMRLRTSSLDRLTVLTNGNVGIGITSPTTRLHLVGDGNDGTNGTLKISNGGIYSMLFDSDEIDTAPNRPLYLNNNSTGNVFLSTGGGNVGIGATTTPDSKFHVFDGSAGAVTALPGTVGTFESGANTFLSVLSSIGGLGGLAFGNPTGNQRGLLLYNHGTDLMTFITGSVTRLAIEGSGDVGIGTISPATRLHVEGTAESNGTTGVFKVTNGVRSLIFDGDEIDGVGNGPILLNNNSTGGVYIGANGTGLKEIIKVTVSIPSFAVNANLCSSQDINVSNVAVDSAVSASPDNGIATGLFIAYARVSSAGIVRIRFCNFTAALITQSTSDFHVAVVR
jgi:hypothetical protein